jgi:hypothetical protein
MTWAVLIVALIVLTLLALSGSAKVAWADKMRRLQPGTQRTGEWMAPGYVVQQVRNDYLMGIRWLRESALGSWAAQWEEAPMFFTGTQLQRHQKILSRYKIGPPRYIDMLDARHFVDVRHFSDDGEHCLVIDRQTERRITTFDYWTREPRLTQALDDSALVYQMRYDKQSRRWKIETFIQELPFGWSAEGDLRRVKVHTTLPPTSGRDH